MPRHNTPPKHKTRNFRQVRHLFNTIDIFGSKVTRVYYTWDAVPLRSNRKDLN